MVIRGLAMVTGWVREKRSDFRVMSANSSNKIAVAGFFQFVETLSKIMKSPHQNRNLFFGLLFGACVVCPMPLAAQTGEEPRPQPPVEAKREAVPERPQKPADKPARVGNQGRRLMAKVGELRRAGKQEEADRLEQRIRNRANATPRAGANARPHQGMAVPDGKPGLAGQGARSRIDHLQAASRHLEAAGYKNLAAGAQTEIRKIAQAAKAKDGQQNGDPALREEVMRLRREIDELRGEFRRLKQ